MKIITGRSDHFSPEERAHLDNMRAEEERLFGPMLDAMLLEAHKLRLVEGHKARERTLHSERTSEGEKGYA